MLPVKSHFPTNKISNLYILSMFLPTNYPFCLFHKHEVILYMCVYMYVYVCVYTYICVYIVLLPYFSYLMTHPRNPFRLTNKDLFHPSWWFYSGKDLSCSLGHK